MTVASATLGTLIEERGRVLTSFVEREADELARTCHAVARAFSRGGTLFALGSGTAATDAAHVAVEFMHPVIVGKRALPALALPNDPSGASTLAALARGDDIALALSHGPPAGPELEALEEARRQGLLTLAMTGGGAGARADHSFAVDSHDPAVVQEVQETAYHVLWELVHVFFEHPGLLDDACITCGDVAVEARVVAVRGSTAVVERDGAREEVAVELIDGVATGDVLLCHAGVALQRLEKGDAADDPSGFLYPFLAAEERDLDAVLADVRESTLRKARDTTELRAAIDQEGLERCGRAVRERLDRGGRLIAFGNGGSSTDAQDLAADALARGWPALALDNDVATITGVSNDVGFDNAFARQLIPLARPNDVALGISTSGSSPNVLVGLEEARGRELLTVGVAGYGGGRLADPGRLDHLLAVDGDYVPRLQEAHATILHLLLELVGERA